MDRKNTLHIVGAGPGSPEMLTGAASRVINSCSFVAGGGHLLGLAPAHAESHAIGADLEAVRHFIGEKLIEGDVCVLTSGDPGCFSILPFLIKYFKDHIQVTPGISSVQLLAARLGIPWQGWELVSLHGREMAIHDHPPRKDTLYFCDDDNSPQAVARLLLEELNDCAAAVGSNLGVKRERAGRMSLREVAAASFPGNSLLLVMPGRPAGDARARPLPGREATAPGIPDELWLRRESIPLSKSEVRAVLLSKAQPAGRRVIWDIGAGTGSYGIECSLLEPRAMVFSIDKNPDACALIEENAIRFGAVATTVCGAAPDSLAGLPAPDLAIIGGNDGRLEQIFGAAFRALNPGGRMLVTALLEETKKVAHMAFAGSGLSNRQATRVSIARGEAQSWSEQNPVIIFTGDKAADI